MVVTHVGAQPLAVNATGSLLKHLRASMGGSVSLTMAMIWFFAIDCVPCRFSDDDPNNPSKDAVLIANRYQQEFVGFAEVGEPARFCFVIDRGVNETSDPKVVFLGFTPANEIVCKWESDSMRVLRLESSDSVVQAVEVAKPQVTPKRRDDGNADSALM